MVLKKKKNSYVSKQRLTPNSVLEGQIGKTASISVIKFFL